MAERKVQIKLLHSNVNNRPLPTTLELGEAVVNTADGIVVFSGDSAGLSTYEQLVDPTIPNATGGTYFEVGSNVYNLKVRNQITSYAGLSNLSGKFLSGTTDGFVLADISDIADSVDSYLTGGTYSITSGGVGTLDLNLNNGRPIVTVNGIDNYFTTGATLINDTVYFDRNDGLSAYTLDLSTLDLNDTFVTGGTMAYVNEAGTATFTNNEGGTFDVTGITDVQTTGGTTSYLNEAGTITFTQNDNTTFDVTGITDVQTTGGTYDNGTGDITFTQNDGTTFTVDLSSIDVNDTFVTGGTMAYVNEAGTITFTNNSGGTFDVIGITDVQTTGATLVGNTATFTQNDGTTFDLDLSALDVNDTFVTGFTYDNANNITISQNEGQPDLTVNISTITGMTNTGNLDLQGELANSTGNVVINDNLDITGTTQVWGNLLPGQHLTYDLGAVGQRWDELYVRKVRLGTTTTVLEDGIFTVSGGTTDLQINPNGDLVVDGDILPPTGSDLVHNLGEPSRRWNNVNAGSITATGMTISGLDSNSVVFTDGSGQLATENGFEYNAATDTMTVGNISVQNTGATATFGQGGVTIGSGGIGDLTVQGDLTVLGDTTTVSTSELYIEDPTITINYNPTGSTNPTSLGAGWEIQDGDGANTDIVLKIAELNTFDSIEYPATTGAINRALYTNINDIIIRQATDTTSPTGGNIGKRVLAEDDCLDAGSY